MTNKKTNLGSLKSLATQLTRWMRPKTKVEVKVEVKETKLEEVGTPVEEKLIETVKPKPKVIRSRPLPKKVAVVEPELKVKPDIEETAKAEAPEANPDLRSPISDLPVRSSEAKAGLLQSFPENKNLVGGAEVLFTLDDKKHSLMVRTDCIYLDAQKYLVSANGGALGGDVELDILDCKRAGNMMMLKVGAFGKDVTISLNGDDTAAMFALLLKGKTSKHTADRGQVIEITRNNY